MFALGLPFPQKTDSTPLQHSLPSQVSPNPEINLSLSSREKQVVDLVCKGKANKQIAYDLHLTEGTVKEYLNRIFRKVGASNRTELAIWAITTQRAVPFMSVAEGIQGNI